MTTSFPSRIALVTGGAVRIGAAICRALAADGCTVAVHCNRSETEAGRLIAAIEADGGMAFAVRGDLNSRAGCRAVVEQVCAGAGGLDILVNNAAVFHKDSILTTDDDALMAELRINTLAPIALTKEFVRARRESLPFGRHRAKGRIVNLLDQRIAQVDPHSLSYSISKKMLAEYTMECAVRLAPDFTVNGVAPGPILPPSDREGARTREWAGYVPLDVRCSPADVASAVLFLVRSDAITGQVIFVDGGQHLL